MPFVLQQFLVRRATGEVFVWSEQIAKRKDLEEVWAETPQEALKKSAMPQVDDISLDQLEAMGKTDLMVFCRVRMGLEVDETMTKAIMCDLVREKLWAQPAPEEAAPMTTRSFKDVSDIRTSGAKGHGGDRATIAGTRESTNPNPTVRP